MNEKISANQKQTDETFSFKWKKRETYESVPVQTEWKRWLFEKYFDSDESRLNELLSSRQDKKRKSILDAGCGSGVSGYLLFGERLRNHDYTGVDISEAVLVAKERFSELGIPAHFMQCDLNSIPADQGSFDIIFSEGVLHHTDSVEKAIFELSKILSTDGHLLFYVYAKKAPIREFTDDFIREQIAGLTNQEAWDYLMPLTKLGKVLGELNIEIDIEDDIPLLGITKGKHNLQRLFYYKFCKAYYRPDYSLDEMNHVNFDWFRPLNCHRHTPEQVRSYCERAGLTVERLYVEESGITVIAQKRK